jgi:glycine/D-amino acid oxidase-like deaminating enzyme
LSRKHVIIVGAGIIGAAFAYHLVRAGARVTVLDSLGAMGGVATPKSWAWINASWGNSERYFRLRQHSMALWRALPSAVSGLQMQWNGGLLWDLPPAELDAYVRQQSAWGYGARLIDGAEARRLEPALAQVPDIAVHVAEEGAVEPLHAVERLLAAAGALGAEIKHGVAVQGLHLVGDVVCGVVTDGGVMVADEVVIAAGSATTKLLSSAGVTFLLEEPAGLLVYSKPVAKILNGLVMAPELHVRQTMEGRLVAGSDYGGADPDVEPKRAADELFARVRALMKNGDGIEMDFYTVGIRPNVPDGESAIGRVNGIAGLYMCVTHSGITLAPVLGALGAKEILGAERDSLLYPFSPDRLLRT